MEETHLTTGGELEREVKELVAVMHDQVRLLGEFATVDKLDRSQQLAIITVLSTNSGYRRCQAEVQFELRLGE